ncbi:tetratricopeptide repeat protein [Cnuibacter physcomitrellae]|uniref:tetratricopeptide repeat protein n=1 Tax=Cnuibacter physcomitrellae TaxID=1619308 RepID=UPI002175CCCE|nr:tetratricopeptide repeat protein [Cnuibacter physcomitrellae]MCS5499063.1 tetratricopeptide repeat protein [Cnuibacter physcomitrellae]
MSMTPPLPGNLRGAVDLSSLVSRAQAPAPTAGGPAGEGAGGASSLIVSASDANFPQIVELSNTVPVLVDLAAPWAEPSQELSAVLDRVVASYGGRLVLARVDVEASPQIAQAFQAQSIPTVAAIIGGRPVGLFAGVYPEDQIRDVIEQVLQLAQQNGVTGTVPVEGGPAEGEAAEPVEEPLPPHHAEAYEAISTGDYDTAIAEYQTAIAQNPRDSLAVAGLAQVQLLKRLDGVSLDDVRSDAAAHPDDLDAQLLVADLDVSGGHIDDAFGRLLDLFPKQDQAGKDRIRARLLDLFEVVGTDDPRVAKARTRLAGLLF